MFVGHNLLLKSSRYGHILVVEEPDYEKCLSKFSIWLDDDQCARKDILATQLVLYQARNPKAFVRHLIETACLELKEKPHIYPEDYSYWGFV